MLGDGRALLLGEQITPLGERFDIQLHRHLWPLCLWQSAQYCRVKPGEIC